jgi:hypothetical protein
MRTSNSNTGLTCGPFYAQDNETTAQLRYLLFVGINLFAGSIRATGSDSADCHHYKGQGYRRLIFLAGMRCAISIHVIQIDYMIHTYILRPQFSRRPLIGIAVFQPGYGFLRYLTIFFELLMLCRICRSHRGGYEEFYLLGHNAM